MITLFRVDIILVMDRVFHADFTCGAGGQRLYRGDHKYSAGFAYQTLILLPSHTKCTENAGGEVLEILMAGGREVLSMVESPCYEPKVTYIIVQKRRNTR